MQGLRRRSWLDDGEGSVADRIALQTRKSSESRPSGKEDMRAPLNGKPSKAGMGIGMSPAPARGIKGILDSIFG